MTKKALIIGIDNYKYLGCLSGCVSDATKIANVLAKNADGELNFKNPKLITGNAGDNNFVLRAHIKDAIEELFRDEVETALLYFAGHGYSDTVGEYICSGEIHRGDEGFSLMELMDLASKSKARNIIIFLDSCHSGGIGDRSINPSITEIRNGMVILSACTAIQHAVENTEGGIFTQLLIDALNGSAANLVGEITPSAIYAHIDQSLGPWMQRPVFKANVKSFVSLRKAEPPIPIEELRLISVYFDNCDHFQLDPTFEPERNQVQKEDSKIPAPNDENTKIFAILQKFARINLVRPVDAPHMWHAAMYSKSCELTPLGKHYRFLAKGELI